MSRASCSARVLRPFMRYVDARGLDRSLVPSDFWSTNPDGRVALDAAQAMLDDAVERLGDGGLGLRLGRSMRFGEGGPFDYAVSSAATLREAIRVAARYSKLLSDSLVVHHEVSRRLSVTYLRDDAWSVSSGEFAMAAFYKVHLAEKIPSGAGFECWFPYPAPKDESAHRASFGAARLRFDAPGFAFAFDRAYADAPMPGADAALHASLIARVDLLLYELSSRRASKARVRELLAQGLCDGEARLESVARRLRVSSRTLSRRLEREGTSFAEELDRARRELALELVAERRMPVKELAFRLGFAHAESFHRAFRRWTGQTPVGYRRR